MSGRLIPAGLSVIERACVGGDASLFDVVHTASRLSVVRACLTQRDAIDAARQLEEIDWDRPAWEIRTDETASALVLAVQADVLKPKAGPRS